ncbi:hypothetical protein EIK80_16625 [Caulobacter sp. 602-1]|nr:hypothetical protein EIK80_16625 [Caulobacter sp. 602-1]
MPHRRASQHPVPNFFDYLEEKSSPRLPTPQSPSVPFTVTDDWPAFVPISEREIAVLEAHLAQVLDELLGSLP